MNVKQFSAFVILLTISIAVGITDYFKQKELEVRVEIVEKGVMAAREYVDVSKKLINSVERYNKEVVEYNMNVTDGQKKKVHILP